MSQNADGDGSNANDASSLFDDTNSVVSHAKNDAEFDPLFDVDDDDDDDSEKSADSESLRMLAVKPHCVLLLKPDFRKAGVSVYDALLRYKRVFKARYPRAAVEFHVGELSDAVASAFGTGSEGRIEEQDGGAKALAIYLHDDNAVARNIFPERVFASNLPSGLLAQRCIVWGWDVSDHANSLLLHKQIRAAGLGSLWGRLKGVDPLKRPLLITLQRGDGVSARIVTADSNENEIVGAILAGTDQPTPVDEDQFEMDSELARELRKSGLSELLRRNGGGRKRTIDSTSQAVSTPKVSRQGNGVSLLSKEIGDPHEESFETASEVDDSLAGNHSVSAEERFERVVLIGPRYWRLEGGLMIIDCLGGEDKSTKTRPIAEPHEPEQRYFANSPSLPDLVDAGDVPANQTSRPAPIANLRRVTLLHPTREDYEVDFYPTHLLFQWLPTDVAQFPVTHFSILYANIHQAFFLPHHTNRTPSENISYLMINLREPIAAASVEERDLCVVMKVREKASKLTLDPTGWEWEYREQLPPEFIAMSQRGLGEKNVFEGLASTFSLLSQCPLQTTRESSTTTGRSLIGCASGLSSGLLFPLEAGLVFISTRPFYLAYENVTAAELKVNEEGGVSVDFLKRTFDEEDRRSAGASNFDQQPKECEVEKVENEENIEENNEPERTDSSGPSTAKRDGEKLTFTRMGSDDAKALVDYVTSKLRGPARDGSRRD